MQISTSLRAAITAALLVACKDGASTTADRTPSATGGSVRAAEVSTDASAALAATSTASTSSASFAAAAPDDTKMVAIAAGTFEEAAVPAFSIDVTKVTRAKYAVCVAANRCTASDDWKAADDGAFPVGATFDNAVAYCGFVGKRLPTVREWLRAAGGVKTVSVNAKTGAQTSPYLASATKYPAAKLCRAAKGCAAGSHPADTSPFGVMDLAGDPEEWVMGDVADATVASGGHGLDETSGTAGARETGQIVPRYVQLLKRYPEAFRCAK